MNSLDKNLGISHGTELTQRQREVADCLVQGLTIAVIADDLGLTESRVNQIIRALKNRLDVDTHAGIVAAYQELLQAEASEAKAIEAEAKATLAASQAGDESLVPDIVNGPHPILYRLVAICAIALMLAATLWMMAEFAELMSVGAEGKASLGEHR